MKRHFLLLLLTGLLLATGIAGEKPPRRTAMAAEHPAAVDVRLDNTGTTTTIAASCDPLCIAGAGAGATPAGMAATTAAEEAAAGNVSAIPPPYQLDHVPTFPAPPDHRPSSAPPPARRATVAVGFFSVMLLVVAAS